MAKYFKKREEDCSSPWALYDEMVWVCWGVYDKFSEKEINTNVRVITDKRAYSKALSKTISDALPEVLNIAREFCEDHPDLSPFLEKIDWDGLGRWLLAADKEIEVIRWTEKK